MNSNTTGSEILARTVTPASFLGPPIVVVGDDFATSDPRWVALSSMAEALSAVKGAPPVPLIWLDPAEDQRPLDVALAALSRLFEISSARPYVWSRGGRPIPASPCGPIFSMPATTSTATMCNDRAWETSARFVRVPYGNLFGVGLMAIGKGDPEGFHGPPVYPIPPPPNAARRLQTLREVWKRGGPSDLGSYQTLIDLESTRFGISRRTHPALVPYIRMS